MTSRSLNLNIANNHPKILLGGGGVRSRSGTRYDLGLLLSRLGDGISSLVPVETYYIRASLSFSKINRNIWTPNTTKAVAKAVMKATKLIPWASATLLFSSVLPSMVLDALAVVMDCLLCRVNWIWDGVRRSRGRDICTWTYACYEII